MDSQDKLTLSITRFDSTRNFLIDIPENITKSILFSINEYNDAELTNNSINYDVYVENIEEGGEIKLSCGESALLNCADHPYPAMEYRIRIFKKETNKSNLYLYKINHSSSTSDSQYKAMISAIGEYDENLLYEQDVKYLGGRRLYNSGYRNLQTLIALISNNSRLINGSLNSIYNNPLLKDKRVVVKTQTPGRQTSKSIIKNVRTSKKDVYYSAQMIQYSDFALNRYLLYLLRFSQIRLKELKKNCENELVKTNARLQKILDNISDDPAKRKKHTVYQIDVFNRRIDRLNTFLGRSDELLFNIGRILTSDTFKGVEPSSKRNKSIIYHPHYLNIERQLYLPLFQGYAFSFANTYGLILSSPIKQTSKLFEAYCLLTLDTAITELGFESITDGFDYDHIVKKFIRDEYEIELMYEIDAKDVSIANKDDVYYIQSDTRHISPDFYLILKNKGYPTCFIIFDAKCRKAEYVQRDIVNGKYENTVRDYLSLRYSTDDNPFFLPKIVDTLWLLVPEDSSGTEYSPANKLEYRIMKLAMDGGENDFVSELQNYISFYID